MNAKTILTREIRPMSTHFHPFFSFCVAVNNFKINFEIVSTPASRRQIKRTIQKATSKNALIIQEKNLPKPIAAQQRTVTTDSVTFKLVIECAGRGLRSQHLVNKYNSKPNNDMISNAAGAEPNIPRLCLLSQNGHENESEKLLNSITKEVKHDIFAMNPIDSPPSKLRHLVEMCHWFDEK